MLTMSHPYHPPFVSTSKWPYVEVKWLSAHIKIASRQSWFVSGNQKRNILSTGSVMVFSTPVCSQTEKLIELKEEMNEGVDNVPSYLRPSSIVTTMLCHLLSATEEATVWLT